MRLIDADALMDLYANRMDLLVEHYGIDSTACGTLSGAMKLLDIQPTIEPKSYEDIVNAITDASFTGGDGLDYVETSIVLNALKFHGEGERND